jgi:hypothetical protein
MAKLVVDALAELTSDFRSVRHSGDVDVRESLALIDLHLRIVYTLYMSFDRRQPSSSARLHPAPGFGTMLAVVRQAAKPIDEAASPWIRKSIWVLARNAASAIDAFRVPKRYANLKSLRDRLSHGGALTSDPDAQAILSSAISALLDSLNASLSEELSGATLRSDGERLWICRQKEAFELEASPLWTLRPNVDGLGVFSHFAGNQVFYFAPGAELWSEAGELAASRFRRLFLPDKSGHDSHLAGLISDTLSDVSAYTEDYSRPSFFFGDDARSGYLHVPWSRTTSEGYESRIDVFRIGANHRREWEGPQGKWSGYTEFLKHISKWDLLAHRIGVGLHSLQKKREDEESSRLGLKDGFTARGPAKLKEVQELGSEFRGGEGGEFFELGARIDSACEAMKPSTEVLFLVGQAGLGKTELMLRLAKERADQITDNPNGGQPLYLFVSSTGRTLSSLEDAVNSALNITRILSSHSARALCRNGLLVLMVDGFDELLGSSGYENALGSLEPWFRDLNGQGVLVASARSSYYLTQYRRSLLEAGDLNVDHTLIELQPWNQKESSRYISDVGVDKAIVAPLSTKDWKVLSVPFFAKAFAAWAKAGERTVAEMPSMYEIVVDQFLDREASKLRNQNSDELLTIEELRSLFSEVADFMQSNKSRELEQVELISCAKMIVGEPLDDVRPGLSRRLSSLGGLGVRADEDGKNIFSFSHEVLFDCFLLLAIHGRLSGVINSKSIMSLITASSINEAVFEWLIERYPSAAKTLSSIIDFNLSDTEDARVASANLGSLWATILKHNNGIPPTRSAKRLTIGSVELTSSGWHQLDFTGSSIAHLVVPDKITGFINLEGARIDYLDVHVSSASKLHLRGIENAEVASLKIGGAFVDSPPQVAGLLQKYDLLEVKSESGNERMIAAAEHYLSRLIRRPDVPMVVDRDSRAPDDPRLSWIEHYDIDLWTAFVDALLASGSAVLDSLPASGKAKVRISPLVSFDKLLKRDPSSEEAVRFWNELR